MLDIKNKKTTVELLLVDVSVGNKEQSIQVFVPVKPSGFIMSKQISPVCTFRNIGNFFWETPEELMQRVHIEEKDQKITFYVDIKQSESSSINPQECVSFRLKNLPR
jgi:hypothetical protein